MILKFTASNMWYLKSSSNIILLGEGEVTEVAAH